MVLYISFAAALLVLHQFQIIQQYLGLPRNIEFARVVKSWLDLGLNSILGQGLTQTFVVGFFWAIVGLGVYVFLRGIMKVMFDIGEGIDQRGYVWPQGANRYQPLLNALQRISFRFVFAVALIFWMFQPLARILDGPVFVDLIGPSRILQYIIWFFVAVATLHVTVILARLFALRERLFD